MCSGIVFAPMLCAISFREGVCIALHAACCLGFRLPHDRYSGEYGLDHDFFPLCGIYSPSMHGLCYASSSFGVIESYVFGFKTLLCIPI
jgi:hypothetical protein